MRRTKVTAALAFVAAAALTCAAAPALAAPGDRDPSFGTGGEVAFETPGSSFANDVVVTPSGDTFVLYAKDFRVVGFAPDGSPLPGFTDSSGLPGKAMWPGGYGGDLSVAADGTLLAAGSRPGNNLGLVEIQPNGDIRQAFGEGGYVEVQVDNPSHGSTGGRIAPDGTVIGYAAPTGDSSRDVQVFGFDTNGAPQDSFGDQGVVRIVGYKGGYTSDAMDMVLDSQGRIVVVGPFPNLWIARITPGGELDASFGSGGVRLDETEDPPSIVAVDVDTQDRPIVLSSVDLGTFEFDYSSRVQRLNEQGSTEPTFGGPTGATGFAPETNTPFVDLVAVSGGRVALAGAVGFTGYHTLEHVRSAVYELRSDGARDAGFGDDGVAVSYTNVGSGSLATGAGGITGAGRNGVLRLLDTSGPPDRDADGLLDPDDRCPGAFDTAAGGCPLVMRRVTGVTKEHGPALQLWIHGNLVTDGPSECVRGANAEGYPINLFRQRKGPDKLVARSSAFSDYFEDYPWEFTTVPFRRGSYYVKSPRRTLPNYGVCEKAKSRMIRITRRDTSG